MRLDRRNEEGLCNGKILFKTERIYVETTLFCFISNKYTKNIYL